MTIPLSEIRNKLKPDVMGWINQAIASATLSGITVNLPSNVAYLDVEQVFTASQTFSAETNVNVITTAVNETHAALTNVYWANPSADDTLGFAIGSWNFGILTSGNVNDFNDIYGSLNNAQHYGTGTLSNAIGVFGGGSLESGGTITFARGGDFRFDNNSSGTITNLAGIYIENPINGGGGTITNLIGAQIIEQTSGGTNNTNLLIGTNIAAGSYSIYNASTRANHFAGSLVVAAHSAFGSSGAIINTDDVIFINETTTITSGGLNGVYSQVNENPGANSSAQIIGVFGVGASVAGNIKDFSGSIRGVNGLGIHGGTGTASLVYGVSASIRNDSSGTITEARSASVSISNLSTGTITAGYGLHIGTFKK